MGGRLRTTVGLALVCGFAGLGVVAAPASAAPTSSLRSGNLKASITHDPFSISFRDHASGRVLRTLGGALPAPDDPSAAYGPLGYSFDLRIPVVNNAFLGYYVAAEAPTVWFHATRVLSASRDGNALVLDVETNDPLGHRLAVRLKPTGEGGITVDSRIAPGSGPLANMASVGGAAFDLDGSERMLGFGSRSNAADQTGNEVFSFAEEGPFSSGEAEDYFRPLLPDFTFPTGPTATNFPIPWLVSTRGFGFLVDQYERSTFHLGDDRTDAWRAEAEANFLRFTVFAGPTPAAVVHRYSDYAGRQPHPAPWIFGPWFQPTLETEPYELANRFRDQDVPVTVAQTYTHYLPCGAHVGKAEAEKERIDAYHRLGYKITTYFNPHICTDYQPVYGEAADNGYLVKNSAGQPYVETNPFTADQMVSEVDFTNPAARRFYGGLLDDATDAGYDGWMEDFGEYTPTDSKFYNGKNGLQMHNRYPVDYHCTSYEHTQKTMGRDAAIFIRSGYHGVQPCARIVWGGDPTEDWSCADGLCAAVHQAISTGLSGIAYQGSDIGGFHAIVNPRTSDELNIRWLEVGAFSGVMRTQANGFSANKSNRVDRSQVWHPAVLPIWRRFSKLRTQLLPYIEAASAEYQRTGMPIVRHLALAFPGDAAAIRRQEEFMFGPSLLAAPVIVPGARERKLYLPGGRWVDLWRTVRYDRRSGAFGLNKRAAIVRGGRKLTVPAPLDQLPLFARVGSVIPFLWNDVDTLAPEGVGKRLVNLGERRDRLKLIAFPRGRKVTRLARGARVVSKEGKRGSADGWSLRVSGRKGLLYKLRASLTTLKDPFAVCSVSLDGEPLARKRWRYIRRIGVLEAKWRTRKGTLRVAGC